MSRLRLPNAAFLLVLALTLIGISLVAADDLRTWTDKSGKFKIEAKFIGIENGKAVLEKADGEKLQIDLDRLSPADKKLAEELQKNKDNPFEKTGSNPFEKKSEEKKPTAKSDPNRGASRNPRTRAGATPNLAGALATPDLVAMDWSGTKALTLFGSEWKAPAASSSKIALEWQPRPVSLPAKTDIFEKYMGMVANTAAKKAVILSAFSKPGSKDEALGRLFWCDLEKGRLLKEFRFVGSMKPLALNASGTQFIVRPEIFGFDNNDKLELWTLSDGGFERSKRWLAVEKPDAQGRDVNWAAFLDDQTVLSITKGGQLTWWNLADLKPLQTTLLQGNVTPALSPDNKLLAGCLNNDLVILDATSGELVAVKPMEQPISGGQFAFSPDNQKLAFVYQNKVDIWNLVTGTKEESINVTTFGQTDCFWTNAAAVMVGAPLTFVDLTLQYPIWTYEGADFATPLGDHGLFLVNDTQRNAAVVVPGKLPHGAALQTVEQAKKDPNFFILKPGAKVRIEVSGITLPNLQADAEAGLGKRLEKNGNSVDANASLTLKATLVKGKDHEITYRSFGEPLFAGGKKYTVPGWEYGVQLVADGKTLWQTGAGTFPPPLLHLNKDETVEGHLQKYSTPSADFFKNVELPKYVARPQGNSNNQTHSLSLRRSQVTIMGLR